MLQCHAKGCKVDNYPLEIHDAQVEIVEAEFNETFIRKMIPRLDWDALAQTILMVALYSFNDKMGIDGFPNKINSDLTSQDCKIIHHALLEYSIRMGKMVCKGCGHVYSINEGIPNMLLQNNQV